MQISPVMTYSQPNEEKYLSQFVSEVLILCSKNSTKCAPQYTGFQTFPILKAFLAAFGIPLGYLQMVPHMFDPACL